MVSPQHFQQQAAYAAWTAECIARLGLSHPWGLIDAAFEPDTLKLGRLQARHLHVRFPDGTLIDTDNADSLPPVLPLESGSQEAVVVLALPLLRANGGNCLKPDEMAARPVRYRQRWQDVRNTFGDDTRQIAVIRPELTLRFAYQDNSDYPTDLYDGTGLLHWTAASNTTTRKPTCYVQILLKPRAGCYHCWHSAWQAVG